jgi:hypothetical protein
VTASDLFSIRATDDDRKFHALDKKTGKPLWEATLPAARGGKTPTGLPAAAMWPLPYRQNSKGLGSHFRHFNGYEYKDDPF